MEAVDQHGVLRGNHVVIVVVRKAHAQAVRRFARFTVPDVIGKDEVILLDIKRLPRPEENVGKDRVEEGMTIAPRAMQQKHGIVGMPRRVAVRHAEREVV